MRFAVSREDLLRSQILQPGVYILVVKDVKQFPGKTDPTSTTTEINFVVESGPDPKGINVPIPHWISEKAAGLAVDLLEKCLGKKIPESGVELDLEVLIGRKVKAYVKPGEYQGRKNNRIDGFLPLA